MVVWLTFSLKWTKWNCLVKDNKIFFTTDEIWGSKAKIKILETISTVRYHFWYLDF